MKLMDGIIINGNLIIDGRLTEAAYAQDESLTSVIIPEGVTDIGEIAFYGCTSLRRVTFPSSLKFIREEAFGETSITEAILPEGLELIGEKAFFSCEKLRKIEVPGLDTIIESDAFGCCDLLQEGFIACGYPENIRHHEELLYTLLWCSCPERHSEAASERAIGFINRYNDLIMEWIIKYNNVPAMSGISRLGLLRDPYRYISGASLAGESEITALLMSMPSCSDGGEFEL